MKRFYWGFLGGIIVFVNYYLIYPWFLGGFTDNWGSFEPVYVAYAEFFRSNFPGGGINQLWYLGFPNRFAFPPAFFYLLSGLKFLVPGVSLALIYHYVTGFFYILLPLALLFFLRTLKVSRPAAAVAICLMLFFPAAAYLLPRLFSEVGPHFFAPYMLLLLTYFGAGPRVVALVFEFMALGCLGGYLRKGGKRVFVLTVILSSVVFLTDQVSSVSLIIFAVAMFLAVGLQSQGFTRLSRLRDVTLAAFGLVSFFYNFSYLKNLFLSPSLGGVRFNELFSRLFKGVIFGVPLFAGGLSRRMVKEERNIPLTFSIIATFFFGIITVIYYLENPDFLTEFVRFMAEFHISSSLLLSILVTRRLGKKFIAAVLVLGLLFPVVMSSRWMRLAKTAATPQGMREYEIAGFLESLHPERVFATGSMAFWLNSFVSIPQVRGGSDQAGTHPWWRDAAFYIREGDDSEMTQLWLRALNVSQIVVSDTNSREFYKNDYKNLYRFDKGYMKLYSKAGDTVFAVALKVPSLAQVVRSSYLPPKLSGVKDKDNLRKYVNWVDGNGREATIEEIKAKRIIIDAQVSSGEALSLQISYDRGWQARDGQGRRLVVSADPLGHMLITSNNAAFEKVNLTYRESIDVWIGVLITLVTVYFLGRISTKRV